MLPTKYYQWCSCVLAVFCVLGVCTGSALASDDAYSFKSVTAYLEAQGQDLELFKDKFDNGQLQTLDEANVINIRYKSQPANYVLYRLNLAEKIKKNFEKQDKQAMLCKEFLYIENKERVNALKFLAYNEALAEKFIPRDAYQVMDDDTFTSVLIRYLDANSAVYDYKKTDNIHVRIENSMPYKNDEGDIGVMYYIAMSQKSTEGLEQENSFLVSYCNGDIVRFEPSTNDPADAALIKMCHSL